MRRTLSALVVLLVLLTASVVIAGGAGGASPLPEIAAGVRLHNQDSRAWKLYVKHRGSAVHTSIGARTITNICSAVCTIKIKDTGATLQAVPGDQVVIKDGRLTRR